METAPATSTTERVADILLALGDGDSHGVTELGRALGLSKAVVHRILQTLLQRSLVRYDPTERVYSLGPAAIALSRAATRQSELHRAASPVMARLSVETGETTILTQRDGYRRFYINQVESSQPIRITITLGGSFPLSVGASGLAMLAFLPDEDVDHVLSIPLARYTDRTVIDTEEVRERLRQVRRQGWAKTSGERVPESTSIAVPIFDDADLPIGSLSAAYLTSRFSEEAADALAQRVRDAGQQVTSAYRRYRNS
jgi:IclR family acetate operon transcriptional repressor